MEEKQYTIEELKKVNKIVKAILYLSFEDLSYGLREKEKKYIEKYFSTFFDKSMENITGNKEMQDVVIAINKILLYGIPGKLEDQKYILNFIDREELRNKIEQNIDVEQIKQGNIPNTQEVEDILNLLADFDEVKCTPAFQAGMQGLKQKGIDIYHTDAMNEYLRNLIFLILRTDNISKIDKNSISFMYDYFNNVTKSKDFNIFKEQRVSDILQLVYANRLPKDISEKIKESLDKNLEISNINLSEVQKNIGDFLEQNNGQIITDEKVFDEFLQNVQKMKLGNSLKINNKTIEFILAQVMDVNSVVFKNPEKYQCVIERTIEDLGRNDLPSKVNKDKGYVYFTWDSISTQNTFGAHLEDFKTIILKRLGIEYFIKNKDIKALDSIFHENTHAVQKCDMNNREYENYLRYLMTKEEILQSCNPDYYQANYMYIFTEIEARENAAKKLGNFLGKITTATNKQAIYQSVLRKDISEFLQNLVKREKNNYSMGMTKKVDTMKYKKVNDFFDEIMQQHPELIESFPILKKEYNEDGTVRRIGEILPEIANVKDNRERIFWRNLINKGNIFRVETLAEDIEVLMNFETKDPGTASMISLLVSDNIGRMLKNTRKLSPEQSEQLKNTLQKVQEYMQIHEGKGAFCKGMLRKSSKDLSEQSPYELMQIFMERNKSIQNLYRESYQKSIAEERKEMTHELKKLQQEQNRNHTKNEDQERT